MSCSSRRGWGFASGRLVEEPSVRSSVKSKVDGVACRQSHTGFDCALRRENIMSFGPQLSEGTSHYS